MRIGGRGALARHPSMAPSMRASVPLSMRRAAVQPRMEEAAEEDDAEEPPRSTLDAQLAELAKRTEALRAREAAELTNDTGVQDAAGFRFARPKAPPVKDDVADGLDEIADVGFKAAGIIGLGVDIGLGGIFSPVGAICFILFAALWSSGEFGFVAYAPSASEGNYYTRRDPDLPNLPDLPELPDVVTWSQPTLPDVNAFSEAAPSPDDDASIAPVWPRLRGGGSGRAGGGRVSLLGRRSLICTGAAGAAAAASITCGSWPPLIGLSQSASAAEVGTRCVSDRCEVSDLVKSPHVPTRLREALRLATQLVDDWEALTSACAEQTCEVSNERVRSEAFLGRDAPLLSLAAEGALRDTFTLSLVRPEDREAYARNSARFESAIKYAADCASLSQFDPKLPRYKKGEYVPKGLKDERGNLLGTNLDNARDFVLDARDALLVACSFVYYTR